MDPIASIIGGARRLGSGRVGYRRALLAIAAAALLITLWLRGEIADAMARAMLVPFEMLFHLIQFLISR